VIGISDQLKPEAAATVKALTAMGIEVWMVTGDNRVTAYAVAQELGLSESQVSSPIHSPIQQLIDTARALT
jgi:Cu+-exporting ATPase